MLTLLDNRSGRGLSELPAIADTFSDFNLYIYNVTIMMINNKNLTRLSNCSLQFQSILLHPCSYIIHFQSFRTFGTLLGISPWFITGFTDAEGCFRISIIKNQNYKSPQPHAEPNEKVKGNLTTLPFSARLYFQIELHRKDEAILESIQSVLGVSPRVARLETWAEPLLRRKISRSLSYLGGRTQTRSFSTDWNNSNKPAVVYTNADTKKKTNYWRKQR